ncbi:MAG: hypothetical protein ACOX8O_08595 [Christensenellales bacterium]|jgi:hypothetical protein
MGKSIDEKIESFYSRFNIKKEMNEQDAFYVLKTRVKDSVKLFVDYYCVNIEIDTMNLKRIIRFWLSEHYGESKFDDIDVYYYITFTKGINEAFEYIQVIIAILESEKEIINAEALAYIVALFKGDIEKCKLDVDIVKSKDGYILIPSGAKELDEKLVNDNLVWLADYKAAYKEYAAALRAYIDKKEIRFIADSLRLSLELFLKQFFERECGIDKLKPL